VKTAFELYALYGVLVFNLCLALVVLIAARPSEPARPKSSDGWLSMDGRGRWYRCRRCGCDVLTRREQRRHGRLCKD